MHRRGQNVPLLVLVILLLTLLYPALFLGYRVAPEASLKGEAPWRAQMGPYPNPSALAVEAATHLGPRLASVAREGTAVALWNPWIGGGRPGWLASPAEGGAPLPLLAGLLARQGWPWTALIAVEIALALAASFWALRALALGAWPAAIGATAYALDTAHDHTQVMLATNGARVRQIESAMQNTDALETSFTLRRSDAQDIDFETASTRFVGIQNTLQAALLSTSKLLNTTLTDYLR